MSAMAVNKHAWQGRTGVLGGEVAQRSQFSNLVSANNLNGRVSVTSGRRG